MVLACSWDYSVSAVAEQLQLSGVRHGPLQVGERITLTDPKGRRHSVVLTTGGQFHTAKGAVSHDHLISRPEGIVVNSTGGTQFLAMRPLLNEFTVSMPLSIPRTPHRSSWQRIFFPAPGCWKPALDRVL